MGYRPRLCWMDGVKVALDTRGMMVKAAQRTGTSEESWFICIRLLSFTRPFLLSSCVLFGPSLWWIITFRVVECRYMIRLGNTVKRTQLLKIQAQVLNICCVGCMLDNCECVYSLT